MLTDLEARVAGLLADRRDDLVALASDLIRLDTTARGRAEEPARREADLQALLGERLRAAGATVDIWEPTAEEIADHPLTPSVPTGFAGRPQLAARLRGAGKGRSLLLNGHIDVVAAEPQAAWSSPPFEPEMRGGELYGRGSCDMKGGIASMVVAAETLAREGVLAGDLVICTNTDEESSGIGGLACARHGVRADAAIVPEPSRLEIWPACRGSVYADVTVPGRAGHVEIGHAHWTDGGAVNAIEKGAIFLEGVRRLRDDWARRRDLRHPLLSIPDAVVSTFNSAGWFVTIPPEVQLTLAVLYLPQQADADGWAAAVTREVEASIRAWCDGDPWLERTLPSSGGTPASTRARSRATRRSSSPSATRCATWSARCASGASTPGSTGRPSSPRRDAVDHVRAPGRRLGARRRRACPGRRPRGGRSGDRHRGAAILRHRRRVAPEASLGRASGRLSPRPAAARGGRAPGGRR